MFLPFPSIIAYESHFLNAASQDTPYRILHMHSHNAGSDIRHTRDIGLSGPLKNRRVSPGFARKKHAVFS